MTMLAEPDILFILAHRDEDDVEMLRKLNFSIQLSFGSYLLLRDFSSLFLLL